MLNEKHRILTQRLEHDEIEPRKALEISTRLCNSANFLVIGDYKLKYGNKYINERETIIKSKKDLYDFIASGKQFDNFGYIIVTDFELYEVVKNNINLNNVKIVDFIGKTSDLEKQFPVYKDIFNHFYFFPFYNQYIARYITNCKEKVYYVKTTGAEQYIEINLITKDITVKVLFGTGDEKTDSSYFSKKVHIPYYYDEDELLTLEQAYYTDLNIKPIELNDILYWIGESDTLLLQFSFNYKALKFISVSEKYDFIRGSYLLNKLKDEEIIKAEEIAIRPNEIRMISTKKHLYDKLYEFTPLYNLKHLNDTYLEEKDFDYVKVSDEAKKTYAIKKNDILISIRGTSFKTAFVVENLKKPGIISSNICILRRKDKDCPPEDIIGDYIFIKSDVFKDFIEYLAPTSSYTNLNTKIFDTLYLPPYYSELEKEKFIEYRKYMEDSKKFKENMDSIETFVFRQDLLLKPSDDDKSE